jgi:hypothetical protein
VDSCSRDRRMFTIHCENIVRAAISKAKPHDSDEGEVESLRLTTRIASLFTGGSSNLASPRGNSSSNAESQRTPQRLRPDMIRRVDDVPKLLNPSGSISEGHAGPTDLRSVIGTDNLGQSPSEGLHDSQPPSSQENRSRSLIESVSSEESRVGRSPKRRS